MTQLISGGDSRFCAESIYYLDLQKFDLHGSEFAIPDRRTGNRDINNSTSMEVGDHDIEQFIQAIASVSAYDFSEYSIKSLKRRLAKVLLDSRTDLKTLMGKITADPEFLEKTVKELTVNTTELFRDPPIWHTLRFEILPAYNEAEFINIWHAGCSTGQEVYSMIILLSELGLSERSNLYATDINPDVLEVARKGEYKYRFNIGYLDNFDKVIKENPKNNEDYKDVSYSKYLDINLTRDLISVNPDLLAKPEFKKMDLVTDPNPFPVKYDLIICRNVIIYFNYNLQNKVFKLFHDNLNQGGCLILGAHETILGPFASYFEKRNQAYIKK